MTDDVPRVHDTRPARARHRQSLVQASLLEASDAECLWSRQRREPCYRSGGIFDLAVLNHCSKMVDEGNMCMPCAHGGRHSHAVGRIGCIPAADSECGHSKLASPGCTLTLLIVYMGLG